MLFLALASSSCDRSGEELSIDRILVEGKKLYSQGNEELIIRHFFRDRSGGVFVDVGAAHYSHISTTYYLEQKLGWSGIAIDAQAHWGADYATHRPHTRYLNYIVTDHARAEEPFYLVKGRRMASSADEAYARKRGEVEVLSVPTATLDDLLDRHGVTKIDFLSMDIEDGEPAALAGFDIERFRPELVCIEAHRAARPALRRYFEEHGYERIEHYTEYDKLNWYFRPRH